MKNEIQNQSRPNDPSLRETHAPRTSHDVLLKKVEVAQRQSRSVRTLQNQRVLGGGIPFLKLGRAVRYRLSDGIEWETARRFGSTSEEGPSRG